MPTNSKPAKGQIILLEQSWESHSSHADSNKRIELNVSPPSSLILEEIFEENQYIGNCHNRKKHDNYEIGIDKLIDFIKENGNKISEKNS